MKPYSLTLSRLAKTWLIDLDGTLLKHNGYKIDGIDTLLPGAKEFISRLSKDDVIIILTSRGEDSIEQTKIFLKENEIHYDYLIYNLPFGERIVINDRKPSGISTSYSVNVNRNEGIEIDLMMDDR